MLAASFKWHRLWNNPIVVCLCIRSVTHLFLFLSSWNSEKCFLLRCMWTLHMYRFSCQHYMPNYIWTMCQNDLILTSPCGNSTAGFNSGNIQVRTALGHVALNSGNPLIFFTEKSKVTQKKDRDMVAVFQSFYFETIIRSRPSFILKCTTNMVRTCEGLININSTEWLNI